MTNNYQKYLSSGASIFMLGNNFRTTEDFLSTQDIMVRGTFSVVQQLETINDTLKNYELNPEIQEEILKWINELNKRYIDSGFSEMYADIKTSDTLTFQNSENVYLSLDDMRSLRIDIRRWKNLIPRSLENEYYGFHKIKTAFMDKNKLLIGLGAFLNGDILKYISDETKNNLTSGIECILHNQATPATMVIFRASEGNIRLLYENKVHKSLNKSWSVMIDELIKTGNVEQPLYGYLDYIRTKRNEAEHPGKIYEQNECEEAFVQVIGLIKETYKEIIGSK